MTDATAPGVRLDVLCVGSINLDEIVDVETYPARDSRVEYLHAEQQPGGPAAVAAVAIARAGLRVGICGRVGDDAAGRRVRSVFEAEGIDTAYLRTDERPTARTVVVVDRDTRERTIFAPQPLQWSGPPVPVECAAWIHVDQIGYAPTVAGIATAQDPVRLSVDAGNPIPGLSLDGASLYAPTDRAIQQDFPGPDLAASMLSAHRAGAERVVVTAGGDGSYVLVGAEAVHVPALDAPILSTLGAGDVFHGALVAGLARGEELLQAVRRANVTAALACRALDSVTGIPFASEIDEYLARARVHEE